MGGVGEIDQEDCIDGEREQVMSSGGGNPCFGEGIRLRTT